MASGTLDPDFRLGIDFGTSHTTAILRWPDGHTRPILFDGSPLLPSAVYADPDGRLLVGRDAIHAARLDPARFEPTPKRRISHPAPGAPTETTTVGDTAEASTIEASAEATDEAANDATDEADEAAHEAVEAATDVRADVSVTDMVAAVLDRVRDEAERVGGVRIDEIGVTLTHPAGWDVERIAVLRDAARQANLGKLRLVPEPVAAAGYFVSVLGRSIPAGSALVVYDFGGGTFDASVVRPHDGGYEVLAVAGLDDVGGVDLDLALLRHVADAHRDTDPEAWRRLEEPTTAADRRHQRHLIEDVRAAKEMLSRAVSATVPVPLLEVEARITRAEFDALARPFLDRTVVTTAGVIAEADTPVAAILLVGGSSRIPLVAELLEAGTGIAPSTIDQPETVVAEGSLRLAEDSPTSSGPTNGNAPEPDAAPTTGNVAASPPPGKAAANNAEQLTPIVAAMPLDPATEINRPIGLPVDPWATSEQPTTNVPLLPPIPAPPTPPRPTAAHTVPLQQTRPGNPQPGPQPRPQPGPRPRQAPPPRYEPPTRDRIRPNHPQPNHPRPNQPRPSQRRRKRGWPIVLASMIGAAAVAIATVVALPYLTDLNRGAGSTADNYYPGNPGPNANVEAGAGPTTATTTGTPTASGTPTPSPTISGTPKPYARPNPPTWLPAGWQRVVDDERTASVVPGPATNGGSCEYVSPGVLHVARDGFDVSGCVMTTAVKAITVRDVAVEAEFSLVEGCPAMWARTGTQGYFVEVCADGTVELHKLGKDPQAADATRIGTWKPRFNINKVVLGLTVVGTSLTVFVDGIRQGTVDDASIASGHIGVGGFAPITLMDATITRFRAWRPAGSGG